jgi:DNA gyrase/topoisomerase IV subunit A
MELELDAKEHMVKELQEKLLQCNKELDDAMKKNMELEQDAKVLEKEKKNMELELDAKELIMKELQEKFLQCKKEYGTRARCKGTHGERAAGETPSMQ